MTRFNTGNTFPSGSEEDFYDNSMALDEAMNSTDPTWVDRFGVEKPTIDAALKSVGFIPAGFDFVTGGTLQPGDRNKAVYNPAPNGDNNWYRWNGVFPKEIAANSQPNPKNDNNWVPVLIKTGAVEREALRRTYLEAGYNLVEGSFEEGTVITSTTDVVLHEKTGKCYSGHIGNVPKGTDPLSGGFVDKSSVSSVTFSNVSEMLSSSLTRVGGTYSTGGTRWEMTKRSSPVIIGDFCPLTPVLINDFGVIGSGVTDDSAIFQNAFDSAINNAYQLGDRYYYRPYTFILGKSQKGYVLSGGITLPENAKIDFQDNVIIPIGGNKFTFKLNLRDYKNSDSTTPGYYYRPHVQGFEFRNATVGDPSRGFGVPTSQVDVEHFVLIDGGWIIRSGLYDIRTSPGCAIKSLIHFDLTHHNPNSYEVGVPDQIRLERVSCQYAENSSYTVSFEGDSAKIGSGSRCGAVIFDAVYAGTTNGFDWNRNRNGSTDFGVIRNKNCSLAEHTLDFVFGGEHLIVVPDSANQELSRMIGMKLLYLNVEKNSDRGTGRGPMLYGGIYSQCNFDHLVPYSEMNRLTRPAQLLDITAENSTFDRIILNDLGHGGNLLPADYINLREGSYGNIFKSLPESRSVNTKNISYYMSMFKVPKSDTEFLWLDRQSRKSTTRQNGLSTGADITVLNLSDRTFDVSSAISANIGIEHYSGSTSTWEIYIQYGTSSEKIITSISAASGDDFIVDLMMTPFYKTPVWNDFSNSWSVIVKISKSSGATTTLTNAIQNVPIDGVLGLKLKARCVASSGTDVIWLGSIASHSYTDAYINEQS